MSAEISRLLTAFVMSFAISYLLTPFIRKLAIKYNFVDFPNRPHPAVLHSQAIPRSGGVPMFIAFLIVSLIFAQKDLLLGAIILGATINVVVGTLDDRYDISPAIRLFFQILSAVILILAGLSFYVSNPFQDGILYFDNLILSFPLLEGMKIILPAHLILVFWIVGLMNASNWSKGVSQLPGVAVISFIALVIVALKYQTGNPYQFQTALLGVISAGAVLAFLPFNFPPEKMFPGFGASTFIGFNLAVLSVLSGGKIATILIVFALPIFDAVLVGIKRIITGRNPLVHDREHLYHFLLNAGLSKKQIIVFYWLTGLILATIATQFSRSEKIYALILVSIVITSSFLFLYYRKRTPQR